MMFGVLGLAILAGFVAGGGALIMGLGIGAALAIYAGTGALALLGTVGQAMFQTLHQGHDVTAGGPISRSPGARRGG